MVAISKKLTLPSFGFFGLICKRPKVIADYLSDSENNWFILEEEIPYAPSKLTLLSKQDAIIALKGGETVCKLTKTSFVVNLHFEELTLADGNTLTLNVRVRVRITDPLRFYRRHAVRLNQDVELTDDNLCDLWEAPFYNVLQVEAHKFNLDDWKIGLTETTIANAIKRYYFAPMAADYVDGTILEIVESVEGNSPSEENRLQEELAKQNALLEQKQREFTLAENQKKHEAEVEIMREQIRLKELEIKAKQEERIAQDAAYQRRKDEEERKALQRLQQLEHEQRLALLQSDKWRDLSIQEKITAVNFSELIKRQEEVNAVEMTNTNLQSKEFKIKGALAKWNTLRKGDSLNFSFTTSKSGFVTILNLGTSGKMTVLLPNALTGSDSSWVKTEQGVRYDFPKSFMPDLDEDSFIEDSSSSLEGIYTIVTPQPVLPCKQTGQLTELSELSYSEVEKIIETLKNTPPETWSGGCLEFQVIN